MKDPTARGGLRSVLVAALCGLFFLLAMGITLLSSGVYRETVDASDQNAAQRTALSYLVNQVRRGGLLGVGKFGGGDAITIQDEAGYVTILYCYDGALRELYTDPGSGLTPADGMEVLPLDGLAVEWEGMFRLTITAAGPDGAENAVVLFIRDAVENYGDGEVSA